LAEIAPITREVRTIFGNMIGRVGKEQITAPGRMFGRLERRNAELHSG